MAAGKPGEGSLEPGAAATFPVGSGGAPHSRWAKAGQCPGGAVSPGGPGPGSARSACAGGLALSRPGALPEPGPVQ